MSDYIIAVILGIVEGVTEYLPVSSTGHMIIVGHMLGFEGTLADLFDVFIQLGAILSVLVVYREKFTFILNTHHWFRTKGPSLLNLAIAMFPACLLGLVFHGFIKNTLFGPMTVIIGLVLGGIFMIVAEKMHKHFSVRSHHMEAGAEDRTLPMPLSLAGVFSKRQHHRRQPALGDLQKSGSRLHLHHGGSADVPCLHL